MLLEKLLLNVLIVLAPIFVYMIFSDRKEYLKSPYVIGIINGCSSLLCLIFSYFSHALYWDLRYVPIVISTLYGGPIAGFINYLFIMGTRVYLGGDALLFGYISITASFLGIFFLHKKITSLNSLHKIKGVTLASLIPSSTMLLVFVSSLSLVPVEETNTASLVGHVLVFGLIQTISAWLAAKLLEFNIERTSMKKEIQRAEKLKALGEVAASIAHEVRNPLTAVQGFLQLMRVTNDKHKNYRYLQIALEELGRAESVIHDYLSFSKPKLTQLEDFCLSDVINNVSTVLAPLASYRGVRLDILVEEQICMHTDRGQLQQALINVIKNSIEASKENTTVQINLGLKYSQAELKIIDQGKGMTPEEIERIGTLFYTTKEQGTGLGTSIALHIIEAMNGSIMYESEKGKGTVCIISLPLAMDYPPYSELMDAQE